MSSNHVDRTPGRPIEILVFKLIQGSRSRTLVAHVTVDSNLRKVIMSNGPGRYRLEWRDRRYTGTRSEKSIQGVTWELRPGDVRSATCFVAR
ncbi:MAG: hypothetical protein KAX42_10555 [Sphaerotilus sp.]|nr:hypothetical protein [Sphaerotilus sp.]